MSVFCSNKWVVLLTISTFMSTITISYWLNIDREQYSRNCFFYEKWNDLRTEVDIEYCSVHSKNEFASVSGHWSCSSPNIGLYIECVSPHWTRGPYRGHICIDWQFKNWNRKKWKSQNRTISNKERTDLSFSRPPYKWRLVWLTVTVDIFNNFTFCCFCYLQNCRRAKERW